MAIQRFRPRVTLFIEVFGGIDAILWLAGYQVIRRPFTEVGGTAKDEGL